MNKMQKDDGRTGDGGRLRMASGNVRQIVYVHLYMRVCGMTRKKGVIDTKSYMQRNLSFVS